MNFWTKSVFRIIFFVAITASVNAQTFTISGYVSDSANGETAIGALVYIKGTSKGVSTNEYGFFSLTLEKGTYELTFSYIGYKTKTQTLVLDKNITIKKKLSSASNMLNEVVITATQDDQKEQVKSTQMGTIKIPIEQIKNVPTVGGETDIVKVMQLMPGVKRGSEGQNGMFVRGGAGDDNLILLDEAVVYNVSHLFGFFSVFNNDALKDITMIKGGFPAQYGGRLSSVMDIRMKEGDPQNYHAEGGVGILSSRLSINGPIIKDKASFLISGRRSYIDQLFKLIYGGKDVLPYYFYDVTAKVNYRISDKDRIFFSTYFGDDVLHASNKTSDSSFFNGGFKLGNFTYTARWNHLFSEKLFANVSIIHTRFRYDVEASVPGNSLLVQSSIKDLGGKIDFGYYKNPQTHIVYGFAFTNHNFEPNVINTSGKVSSFLSSKPAKIISTQEAGFYFGNDKELSARWKINWGGRLSLLNTSDTFYTGLEPRLSATYLINENRSLKFGYARMNQYVHLVSSSSFALPTDLWYPVTKNVKPQQSDQIAIGITQKVVKYNFLITIEAYAKTLKRLIEYREGAVLILNDNYEKELVQGHGSASGFEFMVSRTSGKLTGWIGYTLSWATRQFDELNQGQEFYAKYDRRNDFSIVASYEFTKRFSLSAVWVYSTGQRFTPVVGNFFMPNSGLSNIDVLSIYSPRNTIVLPASHRLDINFIFKAKPIKKWEGEWHVGAYNFYNRAQPYKVSIVGNPDGTYKYQADGFFGFIPSVAYNFKF